MKIEYFSTASNYLNRQMEFKVYGQQGKPVLVFPTSRGRFYQYEDFGMIDAISGFIESGQVQVWTCDGIDGETFLSDTGHPQDRIRQHEKYINYIIHELVPVIKDKSRQCNNGAEYKLLATGCSFGAYHSANIFFRFPEFFDSLASLSGLYSTQSFFGSFMDDTTYYNSPIHFLPGLNDEAYLQKFRQSEIYICCGRGSFEDHMLADTLKMQEILVSKNINAWIDIWGGDVNHNWDWWKKQMQYFLGHYFNKMLEKNF